MRRIERGEFPTLIMICEDMWPPSGESRLPGKPAASQFWQMSMFSHWAQWNRAPMISCMQLRRGLDPDRVYGNYQDSLCAMDPYVCHG